MKLLLTNDDGIHAPGLTALYKALCGHYDIVIVAPESEMSAVGHAITLDAPLRVREINKENGFFGYAVRGTPADCVKIAVRELMPGPPDMILSGINLGANVGVNVLYSGTVSAATEGAFLGIRSAAISLDTRKNPDFGFAARFSRRIIQYMAETGLKTGTALNVNVPAVSPDRIAGVAITRQGVGSHQEHYERRVDPRGNVYYWNAGEKPVEDRIPDADVNALGESKITITPVNCDLTCLEELERLRGCTFPDF